jgi:hypothetical protein
MVLREKTFYEAPFMVQFAERMNVLIGTLGTLLSGNKT